MEETTRMDAIEQIRQELFDMRDEAYQAFQSKLIPNIDSQRVIGVRTPQLRKYAKKLVKEQRTAVFLEQLPHLYYEENNLHAFIIEGISDYEESLAAWERFLPYIDNWATCDMPMPKAFKQNRVRLLPEIRRWLDSGETYTVRFAMGMLLGLFLEEEYFVPEYLQWVAQIHSTEYYVNMMIAWYFATALTKQWDATVGYIEEQRLDVWCHNKTIQKAIESRCISAERKEYLRHLRIKN